MASASERARSAAEEVEQRFNRRFSSLQVRSDVIGTGIGACVYLGLLPPLLSQGRQDVALWLPAAGAVFCAAVCPWPLLLPWLGLKEFYLRYRDHLLLVHFLFHYGLGANLARYVRLVTKLHHGTAPTFLAGFLFSSTLPWQTIDTLLYRMRIHNFVLFKPLVLLASLPLEWALCQQTCAAMPAQAAHFNGAVELLRLLLSPFGPLMLGSGGAESAAVSCFKWQVFLLAVFSFLLPAFVLRSLESEMWVKFGSHRARFVAPSDARLDASYVRQAEAAAAAAETAAAAAAAAAETAAAAAVAAAAAANVAGPSRFLASPPLVAAASVGDQAGAGGGMWRKRRRWWQLRLGPDAASQGWETRDGGGDHLYRHHWPHWGGAIMVAALCWHAIDSLLTMLWGA